jgi:hypothetical protein
MYLHEGRTNGGASIAPDAYVLLVSIGGASIEAGKYLCACVLLCSALTSVALQNTVCIHVCCYALQ